MLGQPLDLAVDVRLDASDDSGNACFEADVFHGDGQVAPSRVRVIVVGGSQAQEAVVRIRSSAIVDEPVVGVVLRSICGQKASRRYDFLTDFPVEMRAAAVPTIIPAIVTAPNPAPAPASEAPAPAPAIAAPAPAPAPARAPRETVVRNVPSATAAPIIKAPAAPRPAPAPKPVQAKESAPTPLPKPVVKAEVPDNKPRLKLESAETPDERVVQLKPSADLLAMPTEDPQKREAAAAAWREINHVPVENAQDKQRLLSLEAESKALKTLLAKNEADFKLRLEKLEGNRFDEGLVYGLIGLLLAAIAAALFFWNRARQRLLLAGTDWAHHGEPSPEEMGRSARSRPAALSSQLPPNTLPGPVPEDPDVDESLFEDLKKLSSVTMPVVKAPAPVTRPGGLTATPARSQQPQDFLDVQQHADFFVSLGQYDQAIEVLKKSIDENIEVNPLAYLELLKIYHTLGRQAEYNQQRDAFNRIFNCQLPVFAAFTNEGQALENYPSVLRNIESQWDTPQVLDLIEGYLFRDPGAAPIQPFDLAAYRELLLLYAMAKTAVRSMVGGRGEAASGPRISTRAALEPRLSQPAQLEDPAPRETTFTQPMLLMPEADPAVPERADAPAEPAVSSYKQPLDLDLDLNLDFSNSELLAMQQLSAVPKPAPAPPPADNPPTLAPLDLDIDDLLATPPVVTPPPPPVPPVIDSNMLEFDLFDPKVEAKISPKTK